MSFADKNSACPDMYTDKCPDICTDKCPDICTGKCPDASTDKRVTPCGEQPIYLSLVIPVYNEEDNLRELFAEIAAALATRPADWEALFIDDGSTDNSLKTLREIAAGHQQARYLSLAANRGQSAAFCAGFKEIRGQVVVTLDADLQNDPADIPALLKLYEQGYDMVAGKREKRQDTLSKRLASRVGNKIRNWLTREDITDTGCSLKVMRASMLREIPPFNGMHRFFPTLLRMQGAKRIEAAVNHRPRRYGVSKYGVLDRAFKAFYDLLAVRWMQSRHFSYQIKEKSSEAGRNGD